MPRPREQRDVAPRAHTADPDHLAGDVDDLVLVGEVTAVAPQPGLVLTPEVVHRRRVGRVRVVDDQGRVVDDHRSTVDHAR